MALATLAAAGVQWLMPAVYYECGRYDMEVLITHQTWSGNALDAQLKRNIITGYLKQTDASRQILSFLQRSPENCTLPSLCSEARRQQAEQVFGSDDMSMNSPLTMWDEEDWLFLDLCDNCLIKARVEHEEACQAFWERLPRIYGLEGWPRLLELRDQEIA